MDGKKISFIIRKQDAAAYGELLQYLSGLQIPNGYQADIVTIDGSMGKAVAYNQGMQQSDAKYKIYIDEHVRILKRDFLQNMLSIFNRDESIGILGVTGNLVIPTNAICRKGLKRVGRLICGERNEKVLWGECSKPYAEVMSLDDCLLMTQNDIVWREDLFEEDCFYDTAQCIEFKRNGYKVALMFQDDYWVQDRRDNFNYDKKFQSVFLDEYSIDVYPLVSIVIPTFNRPKYFELALQSVLNQSYRNLDVFITDNSTNSETEKLMQEYLKLDKRIKYEYHPEFDAADNWRRARCYNNLKAEYVNWLMDDDLFMPNKIERMIQYYLIDEDVTLVTSSRQLIDSEGAIIKADWADPIVDKITKFVGDTVGKKVLKEQENFVGEPTTVLIKKRYLKNYDLGWTGKEGRYLISDFPTWLNLLAQGSMIYIPEPLSCFRIHNGQDQYRIQTRIAGVLCWALEIQYAWEKNIFLKDMGDIRYAILSWLGLASCYLLKAHQADFHNVDVKNLQTVFQTMSAALSNGYQMNFDLDVKE